MPEPREARSIIENAEQAAAAGNYSSAEELLREAAAVQEQTLGPHHPDLANTLNNLGVVCEITDNPIDAEHYFRRAYKSRPRRWRRTIRSSSRVERTFTISAQPADGPRSCGRHRRRSQPGWKRPRIVLRHRASRRRRQRSRT